MPVYPRAIEFAADPRARRPADHRGFGCRGAGRWAILTTCKARQPEPAITAWEP